MSSAYQPIELQCEYFAAAANLIRRALGRLKLKLHETSDLSIMLSDLEWVAASSGYVFAEGGPINTDRKRLARAILTYEQSRRIAATLSQMADEMCRTESIRKQKASPLRKRLNCISDQKAKSHDTLFELELAARLRFDQWQVHLDEPDIILESKDARIGVACKRPKSVSSMKAAIQKAAEQGRKSGFCSFIAISTDAILSDSNSHRGPLQLISPSIESLQKRLESGMDRIASACEREISRAIGGQIGGVVLCGLGTALCENPSSMAWVWRMNIYPDIAVPGAFHAAELLRYLASSSGYFSELKQEELRLAQSSPDLNH